MILVVGSGGQLGRAMQRTLSELGRQYIAVDYPDIDITRPETVEPLMCAYRLNAVVNCAAYTMVDQAESDRDAAYSLNTLGPENLAVLCARYGVELVHISTDYVFSGVPILDNENPRPYVETDVCDPKTVYGMTKLEGDRLVQSRHPQHYILRTAWLYGEGQNFVQTMLRIAKDNDTLRVVNDQFGSPTSAADLAKAVCGLIGTGAYGLYHATCEGYCTWYDFAREIFRLKGLHKDVIPVASDEFPRPAKRPRWSVLENARLKSIEKNVFRDWHEALREYLDSSSIGE